MPDPFASVHANQMDEGDLAVIASHLKDLLEHPGWLFVQDLLEAKAEMVKGSAKGDPALISKAITKDPMQAAAHFAELAGRVRGMGTAREIVHSVLVVASNKHAAMMQREN